MRKKRKVLLINDGPMYMRAIEIDLGNLGIINHKKKLEIAW